VVLFRELQGLTSAETARRLGLTVGAVKARITREAPSAAALGTEVQGRLHGFLIGLRNKET
jgi:DNA-directed RNA polymerase specialized sigma24 family protein